MPSAVAKPTTDRRASSPAVLDPRSLGRPVHRLAEFARRFEDELNLHWAEALNQRYQAALSVAGLRFVRDEASPLPGRWLAFRAPAGVMGWRLSREAALCLLAYRYGLPQGLAGAAHGPATAAGGTLPPAPQPASTPTPETASEERLVQQLGQQVLALLARRLAADPAAEGAAPQAEPLQEMPCLGALQPEASGWRLRGELLDARSGCAGQLTMALDAGCMERLFKTLEAGRSERARGRAEAARPFPHRLGLTLTARLLQKELPLGTLLDLRVGDVLPVRLGATDVLIDEARLFTATVAERQGKLCLTTFDDAE